MKKVGIYELIRQIGKGSYGKVYEARKENSNEKLAVKMIPVANMDRKQIDLVQMEIDVLQKIDHPNIIKLFDVRRTKNNYYLVFEFCEKGDLQKYLKKYCEVPLAQDVIQKLIYQISDAVRLIHSKNIVHRDIKLSNILLTQQFMVKLSDFGFAKNFSNELLMETYCGTPMNMAPQILLRQQYTQKCDVWSLGIVTYQLVYGKLPFMPSGGKGLLDLIEAIQKFDEIIFPEHPKMSESFKSLIKKSLQKDPQKRINIEQFFQNEWVQLGKFSIGSSSLFLKSISGVIDLQDPQSPLLQNVNQKTQNSQKIIANRIYDNIHVELLKLNQKFKQITKGCQKMKVKPLVLQQIVQYLHFSFVRDIKQTLIKVVYKNDSFQFLLKDVPSLENVLETPPASELSSSFSKTIQLLESVADQQKNNKKHQSLQDYKTILSIFPLFCRFSMCISVSDSSSSRSMRLKGVKKWLFCCEFECGCCSGVSIITQYSEKNQDVGNKVQRLKMLVEQRVLEIEKQIGLKI